MPDENNSRITQAVLKQVVENNTRALEKIDKRLKEIDDCVRGLESRMTAVETKQQGTEDDVDRLQRNTSAWNGLNSLGAFIAGILAWFK